MPAVVNLSTRSPADIEVGWVNGPNGRGTLDIIWGSLFTIFLCTWTAVCLNVSHPNDRKRDVVWRKTKWMFWAVVGPEIVLSIAIGQYASARRSVRKFKRLGYDGWTLRHAFFADMGGVILRPAENDPTIFVVNSRQLAYLVEHKYTALPPISAKNIWDKSKADTMARLLTLAQALWLIVQLIGRAIQGLSTTTLELSAAAIVFCTFGTFVCWLRKPSDVEEGIELPIQATTAQILLDAGEIAAEPYLHTPLDFVARQSPTCGYDVMKFFNVRFDNRERPLRMFPNDRFPNISTFEKFALFCMSTAYAAFHLIGWNFYFPTRIERLLWRISSGIFTGATFFFWVFETIAARQRFGRWDKYLIWLHLKKKPVVAAPVLDRKNSSRSIDSDDAFETEMKQAKPIPWWEVALLCPIVVLYIASRAYLMVEVFVSLRQLPAAAYQTVEISRILPHL